MTIRYDSSVAGEAVSPRLETSGMKPASDALQDRQEAEVTGYFAAAENGRPWILCVDDDVNFSYMLKLRLEEQGVNVLRAFNGTDGYRYALSHPGQGNYSRLRDVGGNGEYALRRLKENPLTSMFRYSCSRADAIRRWNDGCTTPVRPNSSTSRWNGCNCGKNFVGTSSRWSRKYRIPGGCAATSVCQAPMKLISGGCRCRGAMSTIESISSPP